MRRAICAERGLGVRVDLERVDDPLLRRRLRAALPVLPGHALQLDFADNAVAGQRPVPACAQSPRSNTMNRHLVKKPAGL